MKRVMNTLRIWFGRIKFALWLHPEFDAARRYTMFGVVAVVSAGILSQVTEFMPEIGAVPKSYCEELSQITRRGFMPRMYVKIWKQAPLISELLA